MDFKSLGLRRFVRAILPAFLLAVSVGQIYAFTNFSDEIARYIGSAREVVTKMLKYFQSEGVLTMRRGRIQITDKAILQEYL